MKLKSVISILLLMAAGLQTAWAQKMIVRMKGNQTVEYNLSQVEDVLFVEGDQGSDGTHGFSNGHEWVDLGLPSGTLWATCNVGAGSPEEYGGYFAWGETNTKDEYSESNYKYYSGNGYTKYCYDRGNNDFKDYKTVLEPMDDAATKIWGEDWQMPSVEQFDELIDSRYVSKRWVTQNDIDGVLITSKSNGESIFLPTIGGNWEGRYWSRSLVMTEYWSYGSCGACQLYFNGTPDIGTLYCYRETGCGVRPVRKTLPANPVTQIVLSDESLTLQLNETKTLTATVFPSDASYPVVSWESNDEAVATVSYDGTVKAIAAGTCTISCYATDGSGVKAECQVTVEDNTYGTTDGHDWIDLGLPSGTLWATCNVGASSPEEYGDYFAWGETEPKEDYSWNTYKLSNGSRYSLTKYCTNSTYGTIDNKTELEPVDDAATSNWSKGWQMPSMSQFQELYNSSYTITEWITLNNIKGRRITSKSNGKSIFLPAAGHYDGTTHYNANSYGGYWSRMLYTSNSSIAYNMFFGSGNTIDMDENSRSYGASIRPVCKQDILPAILVTQIVLSDELLTLQLNETKTLTATVFPSDASYSDVAWESSDEAVATVSYDGQVTAVSEGSCFIICIATDGSGVKAECQVTVEDNTYGTTDGHDWVDLGLPSGTLWATCNVGASSPEEYGDNFAWGETEPKEVYSSNTYKYCDSSSSVTMTKYGGIDNLTNLLPEDDAATINWGGKWRMPTAGQINELCNSEYTESEWTAQNGINGLKITSKSNGKSIFLPATGFSYMKFYDAGSTGYYWSRSLYNHYYASYLHFKAGSVVTSDGFYRACGVTIRPILVQN